MDDLLSLTVSAMLDGGGETWETLAALIARRIDELGTGQILRITSYEPVIPTALLAWCQDAGHHVIGLLAEEDTTHLWIKKGDPYAH